MDHKIRPYPLTWPIGYPRTGYPKVSQFKVTLAQARDGILAQLKTWVATGVVISSDAPLRNDGLPYAAGPRGSHDAGVCVYFTRKKENWAIPCDHYQTIRDNMQAIRHIIEAMRAIERHGGAQALHSASAKFKELPAAEAGSGLSWWEILGVSRFANAFQIKEAFNRLALKAHPDQGGTTEEFQLLTEARDQALATFKSSNK